MVYLNFLLCFLYAHFHLPSICRKGLVELFDMIDRGELKEGAKLSSLVSEMHEYRYFFFSLNGTYRLVSICVVKDPCSNFSKQDDVFVILQTRGSKKEVWITAWKQRP